MSEEKNRGRGQMLEIRKNCQQSVDSKLEKDYFAQKNLRDLLFLT